MGNRHQPNMRRKSRDFSQPVEIGDEAMREKRERSYEKMYKQFEGKTSNNPERILSGFDDSLDRRRQ